MVEIVQDIRNTNPEEWLTPEKVAVADSEAPKPLYAVEFLSEPKKPTRTSPIKVRCDKTGYWVKNTDGVARGRASELIVGRLGRLTGLAPDADVVSVPPHIFTEKQNEVKQKFEGLCVGIQDVPGAENTRDLEEFVNQGTFGANRVDYKTWVETIVFQTWVGVGDAQGLVVVATGEVCSLDHEDCINGIMNPGQPVIVIFPLLGLVPTKEPDVVEQAVSRIESVTDEELVRAVASGRDYPAWMPSAAERLEIARRLAQRRGVLRAVMEGWVKS